MTTKLLTILLILIPTTLFGWLAWQELVPTGVFEVEKIVGERSPFLDPLLPDGRVGAVHVDEDGDQVRTITDDPVFFFAHPHRGFDEIEAELWFKNNGVPIVEFGALAREEGQIYDLKPLQNQLIDKLTWPKLENGDLALYQREPVYDSVEEFLKDPPDRQKVATYHATLSVPVRIESPLPQSFSLAGLQGFHEAKLFHTGGPLFLPVAPEGGEVVVTNSFGERQKDLRTLPEGIYRIEWRIPEEELVPSLEGQAGKFVFLNQVKAVEHEGSLTVWTDTPLITLQTDRAEGVQDVAVGDRVVKVEEPFKRYTIPAATSGEPVKVTAPHGHIILQAPGAAFSPSQELYFRPDPVRLTSSTNLDRQGIDYLLTTYEPPRKEGDWLVADGRFNARDLVFTNQTWKFAFSVPGIQEAGGELDIGKMRMVWKRPTLWETLKQKLWNE